MRLVFLGWGAINTRVGALLAARKAPVEIIGIATTGRAKADRKLPDAARLLAAPEELADLRPDLVVEAAGRMAVQVWLPHALQNSKLVIVASTSMFCDDAFLDRSRSLAERFGSRILIPSGAIGGIDALGAASVLGLADVTHEITKPPAAWRGTHAENVFDLSSLTERTVFFTGSAREAARDYPQNANATVVTSLAGIGLDQTKVKLIADPSAVMNGHRIVARGAFGSIEIKLENSPLATNPKSSELTALSIVRLIEQQKNIIVI